MKSIEEEIAQRIEEQRVLGGDNDSQELRKRLDDSKGPKYAKIMEKHRKDQLNIVDGDIVQKP